MKKEFIKNGDVYSLESGVNKNSQTVFSLWQTHYKDKYYPDAVQLSEPIYIKCYGEECPDDQIVLAEIELNDWSRWNTELPKGQNVEISENVFWQLFGAVPPRNVQSGAKYFECGEAHHHDNGKAIYRACWIKDGKFYTGYPKA